MTHFSTISPTASLLCDGAMGTQVQARNLDIERDFLGHENCTEILCESRPDLVREIHRGYLEAGCDAVQTNSFGGSPITLGEFGIADRAFALNRRAAELAREAVAEFAHDGRTRFVLGSVGPGTRLPSLGHVAYQDARRRAARSSAPDWSPAGSTRSCIETCQDPLQIKAAVNGAKRARDEAGKDTPIIVQVTVETTGTLLVGADIAAAATIIHALDVPMIGLNCATGPREMAEHVKWLGENWPGHISVQPNAGLPELVDGRTHYPLGAAELAQWLERFVLEDGVGMIGGCCGTEVAHIAALDADAAPHRPGSSAAAAEARSAGLGARRSPRSTARCRCARKTPICRSASAATPTARANSAGCRSRATGTAASRWAASRSRKARTRSISAPPLSGATRSPT